MPGVAHGFMVLSTIANGRIRDIDTTRAHARAGRAGGDDPPQRPAFGDRRRQSRRRQGADGAAERHHRLRPPAGRAWYWPTRSNARKYAASLVVVSYDAERPQTTFAMGTPYKPQAVHGKDADTLRGDARGGPGHGGDSRRQRLHDAARTSQPDGAARDDRALGRRHPQRLRRHARRVLGARTRLASMFGVPPENVRVIAKFIGGGFGAKGSTWPHTILAAMAAKMIGRAVKIAIWRPQMWGSVGYRSPTVAARGAGRQRRRHAREHDPRSALADLADR